MAGSARSWSPEQVQAWLASLELDSCVAAFKRDAVDGKTLCDLSAEELVQLLGLTPLQARKIRSALEEAGNTPPPPKAPAPAPPPAAKAARGAAPRTVNAREVVLATDLHRYKELSAQITGLQEQRPNECLGQAQASVQGLSRTLQNESQAAAKMADDVTKEQRRVEKLTPGTGCCLFLVPKADAKLEVHQKALKELQGQLASRQARISELRGQLAAAQADAAAWQAKVSQMGQLSSERQALMEKIFAAPAWDQDTTLQGLKAEIGDLGARAAEAQRGATAYGQGTRCLQQADSRLQQAMELLRQTRFMSIMEMGFGGYRRRDPIMDIMEMSLIRQANDHIAAAANDVMGAQSALPSLPQYITEDVLSSARMGVFANLLFGGFIADLMEMEMIRNSMQKVEQLRQGINQALQWTHANAGAYGGNLAQLQAGLAAKRGEQLSYWHKQLLAATAA